MEFAIAFYIGLVLVGCVFFERTKIGRKFSDWMISKIK